MKHYKPLELAQKPTPLNRLNRMSELLNIDLWIKRDDLTGDILTCGNKIRKLEYIFADAVEKKADTVLVAGGIQSNLAKTTAALAVRLGIRPVMVLAGEKPDIPKGNFFLASLLGVETRFVEISHPSELEDAMKNVSDMLEREGAKPYTVGFGASNGLGAMGYVDAYKELSVQIRKEGVEFDHEFLAAGSGGTMAGIMAGSILENSNSLITGISPWLSSSEVKERVWKCIMEMVELLDINPGSFKLKKDVEVDDSYIGSGYGIPTSECINAIRKLAREEAILIDHTYTGKAMAGLLDYVRKGKVKPGERVLFWHTGGAPALFSLGGEMEQ